MAIRFAVLGFFSFMAGAVTMFMLGRDPDFIPAQTPRQAPVVRETVINEEFEEVERRLRDMRNPDWNLIEDMKPCFPGSRLCFLLSGGSGPVN